MEKSGRRHTFHLLSILLLLTFMTPPANGEDIYKLTLRSQEKTADGNYKAVKEKQAWDPAKSAIIICDMWDGHWCKGAERRVGAPVPMSTPWIPPPVEASRGRDGPVVMKISGNTQ
ncbi:MAG: hypothetical protein ACI9QL_002959 [Candidatus Omnitrophota bacterium]|jgi:hypothetical protein